MALAARGVRPCAGPASERPGRGEGGGGLRGAAGHAATSGPWGSAGGIGAGELDRVRLPRSPEAHRERDPPRARQFSDPFSERSRAPPSELRELPRSRRPTVSEILERDSSPTPSASEAERPRSERSELPRSPEAHRERDPPRVRQFPDPFSERSERTRSERSERTPGAVSAAGDHGAGWQWGQRNVWRPPTSRRSMGVAQRRQGRAARP